MSISYQLLPPYVLTLLRSCSNCLFLYLSRNVVCSVCLPKSLDFMMDVHTTRKRTFKFSFSVFFSESHIRIQGAPYTEMLVRGVHFASLRHSQSKTNSIRDNWCFLQSLISFGEKLSTLDPTTPKGRSLCVVLSLCAHT